MIIRLIDIVLLVLFGFVSIAQLEDQTKVELPRSAEIPAAEFETRERITITVDLPGKYYIPGEYVPRSLTQIKKYLAGEMIKWEGREMRVLIRSDRAAPMASIKQLVKECNDLGIESSLVIVKDDEQAVR